MSYQRCHIRGVISEVSYQRYHIRGVISMVSYQRCHIRGAILEMSYQRCHIRGFWEASWRHLGISEAYLEQLGGSWEVVGAWGLLGSRNIDFTMCFWQCVCQKCHFTMCFWHTHFKKHMFYSSCVRVVHYSSVYKVWLLDFTMCFWWSLFKKHVFFSSGEPRGTRRNLARQIEYSIISKSEP